MTVYDHIDFNRRRTVLILALFPAALFLMVSCVCALAIELGILELGRDAASLSNVLRLTMAVFPWLTGAAFLWIFFSYLQGDNIILGAAGAREITSSDNPKVYALVENVAIMAGLPTPKVYMIDDESLNAFATGRTPETASIALTIGIVSKLKPNELESVIAHEMGHIGNRDTKLMIIVVTGIAMFTFMAELAFRIALNSGRGGYVRSGGRRSKGGGQTGLFFLAVALACWIFGVFVAPLIRMALSRNREFLADATSARITRNPDALADALAAIAEDPRVEVLDSRPLMGALCVANPLSKSSLMASFYATHPPIEERIDRLRKMARDL
ncbi:MAG: M48 family metallopeptidase [Synergistaceae bacterium]|jgi:heat shock protein HtpX|nr:M48 family metallopeptidase [Synergistaceae bacterium]